MRPKTLIVFGLLDLITLVRNLRYAENFTGDVGYGPFIVTFVLFYVSLVISCILLMLRKKAGIWLSYAQFPIRLLFMILSFGFLLEVNRFLDLGSAVYDAIIWLVALLEVLRLYVTIQIHRKLYATVNGDARNKR